jgi:hypothetical protein
VLAALVFQIPSFLASIAKGAPMNGEFIEIEHIAYAWMMNKT